MASSRRNRRKHVSGAKSPAHVQIGPLRLKFPPVLLPCVQRDRCRTEAIVHGTTLQLEQLRERRRDLHQVTIVTIVSSISPSSSSFSSSSSSVACHQAATVDAGL